MRLLQVTDTHLFADPAARLADRSPQQGQERVLAAIAASGEQPDALLVTGDLSHDGSEAAYRRLRRALEPLAPRVLVIPGNHDDPARMARLFASGTVRWVTSERLGDWRLILLNSVRADSAAGRLGGQQLGRLDELLMAEPDRPTLIALHHQPVPVGAPWLDDMGLEDGDALLARVSRHRQVRAVVWGHVHQAFDRYYGGARLLATPATSTQFRPGSPAFALDERPPGYRWLTLAPDGAVGTGVVRVD